MSDDTVYTDRRQPARIIKVSPAWVSIFIAVGTMGVTLLANWFTFGNRLTNAENVELTTQARVLALEKSQETKATADAEFRQDTAVKLTRIEDQCATTSSLVGKLADRQGIAH